MRVELSPFWFHRQGTAGGVASTLFLAPLNLSTISATVVPSLIACRFKESHHPKRPLGKHSCLGHKARRLT